MKQATILIIMVCLIYAIGLTTIIVNSNKNLTPTQVSEVEDTSPTPELYKKAIISWSTTTLYIDVQAIEIYQGRYIVTTRDGNTFNVDSTQVIFYNEVMPIFKTEEVN